VKGDGCALGADSRPRVVEDDPVEDEAAEEGAPNDRCCCYLVFHSLVESSSRPQSQFGSRALPIIRRKIPLRNVCAGCTAFQAFSSGVFTVVSMLIFEGEEVGDGFVAERWHPSWEWSAAEFQSRSKGSLKFSFEPFTKPIFRTPFFFVLSRVNSIDHQK
jgi:hypothetical protein